VNSERTTAPSSSSEAPSRRSQGSGQQAVVEIAGVVEVGIAFVLGQHGLGVPHGP
jgi:hypothetical protein